MLHHLNSPLHSLFTFLEKPEGVFRLHGLKGSSPAFILSRLYRTSSLPFLIVTADEEKAERFLEEVRFFSGSGVPVDLYPGWDGRPFEKISPSLENMGQRWRVRHKLLAEPGAGIVVAPIKALLQRIPPRKVHLGASILLAQGKEGQREEVLERLSQLGYSRVSLVHEIGEFAVRGNLLDFYSPAAPVPLRVEFFGDQVEAIRAFDPDTQRSLEPQEEALILPVKEVLYTPEFVARAEKKLKNSLLLDPAFADAAEELLEKIRQGIPFPGLEFYCPFFYDRLESFFDTLSPQTCVFLDEPPELEEGLGRFFEEVEEGFAEASRRGEFWPTPRELYLSEEEFAGLSEMFPRVTFQGLEVEEEGPRLRLETDSHERLRSELLASKSEEGILRVMAQRIRAAAEKGVCTILTCSSLRSAERLDEMLARHNLRGKILNKPFPDWTPEDSSGWDVTLILGNLSRGFSFPQAGLMIISEAELFGEKRLRKRRALPRRDHALTAFSELSVGDYVVHTDHGIGIYRG
ncbi:MAG: hypothetical protein NTY64_02270, partial [Deltaproteobacteria bacterium]|nr:hypothetical protein [Deltaproteobacteria bacterium]